MAIDRSEQNWPEEVKIAEVEGKFSGKKVEAKRAKDWWGKEFWGDNKEHPADPEFAKFGDAICLIALRINNPGRDVATWQVDLKETEILCISPNNFAWPPEEGFSQEEIEEFSRLSPTTLVSVMGEETEFVYLNGEEVGQITSCRSDVFWHAGEKKGRNY